MCVDVHACVQINFSFMYQILTSGSALTFEHHELKRAVTRWFIRGLLKLPFRQQHIPQPIKFPLYLTAGLRYFPGNLLMFCSVPQKILENIILCLYDLWQRAVFSCVFTEHQMLFTGIR